MRKRADNVAMVSDLLKKISVFWQRIEVSNNSISS